METHEEVYRFIGVTSDDRIEEFNQVINVIGKNFTRMGRFPAFDLVTFPVATGSKEYIEYAQIETLREKPDSKDYALLQSENCIDKKYEANVMMEAGKEFGKSF